MDKTKTTINECICNMCKPQFMPDENHWEPGCITDDEANFIIDACSACGYTVDEFMAVIKSTDLEPSYKKCMVFDYVTKIMEA